MGRCDCGALVEYDVDAIAGGQDQWAQCDECGKWREVDGAQLAAIEARSLRRCGFSSALYNASWLLNAGLPGLSGVWDPHQLLQCRSI